MQFLVDTHVVLWLLADDASLGVQARGRLEEAEVLYVSAASIWEAQIKAGIGKMSLPKGFLSAVAATGFKELAIDWEATVAIDEVKLPHRDPFDRLLVVQALQHQIKLVTADEVLLASYPKLCLDART